MTDSMVTFISTQETEKQRLLNIAVYIVNRFWQTKRFFLLPYDVGQNKFSGREIFFPELGYPQSFWKEAKRLAKNPHLITTPLSVTPQISLPNLPPDTAKLENKWRKAEKEFWKFCLTNFPDYFSTLKTFEIWVTRYNRLCSFTKDRAWVHFQGNAGDIAEAILSGAFRQKNMDNGYTWEESESFTDNLILNSSLSKLFPDWKPTLTRLRTKGQNRYAADSRAYLKRLGYTNEPIFSLYEGQIAFANQPITSKLTPTENEILKRLLAAKGQIVTFEEIGDIIWKKDALDNYSEWAIAKAIQRLRNKISSLGITPETIQTKRGQGYWLVT